MSTQPVKARRTKRSDLLPYPEFPLFPHASKRWAKKIKGSLHYFGPWSDPQGALKKYQEEKDDLYAGRKPRPRVPESFTIANLVNYFLESKKHSLTIGEITQRTYNDYDRTCELLLNFFGASRPVDDLRPADFESFRADLAKTMGPVTLGNQVMRSRIVFKYGFDADLIERPVKYGPRFKPPGRKVLRKARHAKGPRLFTAEQLRKLLKAAKPQMKAMILLGINCGFGNHDVALLPIKSLNLKRGWLSFPRPKTGISRRIPLWPETVQALNVVLAERKKPADSTLSHLVFVTKYGQSWAKETSTNPVSAEFRKLLKELKLYRLGLNFYALRHTFQTIGEKTRDKDAVRAIMGHVPASNDMSAVYNEEPVEDERLRAVVDFMRRWLDLAKISEAKS